MRHEESNNPEASDALDAMLKKHFDDVLGPQVGRARERFASYIDGAKSAQPIVTPTRPAPGPRFRSFWAIGLIGGAVAAALSVVSMRHAVDRAAPQRPSKPTPQNVAMATMAQRGLTWETLDQGVVELDDGSYARQLLQRRLDTTRWYDAKRKATIEYVRPQEETVFVGLNKY